VLGASRLYLGGNVFGWTADRDESFAVIDAYVASGGNLIDTSDSYSDWEHGHVGGESETIIGEWLASRGRPDGLMIATKVGQRQGHRGLHPDNVRDAVTGSLTRSRRSPPGGENNSSIPDVAHSRIAS
jgi:aryl-alcohol dehydrogenase-like predicted oxidoreductase